MPLTTLTTIDAVRAALKPVRQAERTIGLVPTMGNLHAGHQHLVQVARAQCDVVIASVFVNPTQFGAGEDFETYPRTLAADQEKLAEVGCDFLFAPTASVMYPTLNDPMRTRVSVSGVSEGLCGAARPGHFDGVATVVSKLFHIIQPNKAFFGEKDYQQLAVIRQFTTDLFFPIEIIGVPTVRAEDGLALSSRNGYLNADERILAPAIQQTLRDIGQQWQQGNSDFDQLSMQGQQQLTQQGFVVDYFAIHTPALTMPHAETPEIVILTAARLGKTRLIDNLTVKRTTS